MSPIDYNFVAQANLGAPFQIDSGRIAEQKATTAGIRDYAHLIVVTHIPVAEALAAILRHKRITAPPETLLQGAYGAMIASLKADGPTMRDRDYVKGQVEYQEGNAALFQYEIQNGSDPKLKEFARQTLPKIEDHLSRAKWDYGPNATYDTTAYRAQLAASANRPGRVVRNQGDVAAVFATAQRRVAADHFVPHYAHAAMEPLAAVANATGNRCEVWAPTQNPQAAKALVAQVLGFAQSQVTLHVTPLGGGFGRKSKPDYVAEAALLSHQLGAPVKVTWTRPDDIRHDYYHTICAQHLEAALDAEGRATAWLHRSVFPPIEATFQPDIVYGGAPAPAPAPAPRPRHKPGPPPCSCPRGAA